VRRGGQAYPDDQPAVIAGLGEQPAVMGVKMRWLPADAGFSTVAGGDRAEIIQRVAVLDIGRACGSRSRNVEARSGLTSKRGANMARQWPLRG
jgi:hypothetical protein